MSWNKRVGAGAKLASIALKPIGGPVVTTNSIEPIGGRFRVWNHNLPPQKAVAAFRLCGDLGLNPYQKLVNIPDADFEGIKAKIESTFMPKHAVLKRIGDNILAKVRMGSYQGLRHQMCLPVHGQRTRTNARTQRRLGILRAQLYNIPILNKKARAQATAGGIAAGSTKGK